MQKKEGVEFDGLKNKDRLLRKYESVDIGISDDQQQQTKSAPSSTDTTSAVKPSVIMVR